MNKVLVFNTGSVNSKASRDSQGIQVLKSKKGSIMTGVFTLEEIGLLSPDYYKTANIPAVGCYLKDEDVKDLQIRMDV